MRLIYLILLIIISTAGGSDQKNTYKDKKTEYHYYFQNIMDRLIKKESGGDQSAKSKRKGKKQAFTMYQINGEGLQYFNEFNRINEGKRLKFTMGEIIMSVAKSKIVSEWIVRRSISHYKKKFGVHQVVFALNSYNMGYGNTAKDKFYPEYLSYIIPYEWYIFTLHYEPYKWNGRIVYYRKILKQQI